MWRWPSGECKVLQGHKEQVRHFSLLSDSSVDRLLSWSFDGTVKVKFVFIYTVCSYTLGQMSPNEKLNRLCLFPICIPRCGTRRAERSCRTSRLIREPFCHATSRQTDASSPPPLQTRPQRFGTYSPDETSLFVLPVAT